MGAGKTRIVIWAALFFFGFTLLGGIISWLIHEIFGVTWIRTGRPWEFPNAFLVIPFALLLASYFFVRRLNHHMMSHLWLYAIVLSTIGFISAPVMGLVSSASTLVWWATAFGLSGFIVLIWFARRISAMSFRHSLLFIALTAAVAVPNPNNFIFIPSHIDVYSSVGPSPAMSGTLWVGAGLLGVLAVWALANTRAVVSTTRTVLPPVLAILLLSASLMALAATTIVRPTSLLDWIVPMLTTGLSSLIAPALAVLITYTVRVRRRASQELEPNAHYATRRSCT